MIVISTIFSIVRDVDEITYATRIFTLMYARSGTHKVFSNNTDDFAHFKLFCNLPIKHNKSTSVTTIQN